MTTPSKAPKKVIVIGSSCAGKTTFAARLAEATGLKHVELDALFWEPGWKEAETATFRSRVADALSGEGWVVDGNYKSRIKDIAWSQADTFIWLDPSLTTVLRRFLIRSLTRAWKGEVLWGGCKETLRNSIFQRNSLLIWILKTHNKKTEDYLGLVTNPPAGVMVHRLRGKREVEAFFQGLKQTSGVRRMEG